MLLASASLPWDLPVPSGQCCGQGRDLEETRCMVEFLHVHHQNIKVSSSHAVHVLYILLFMSVLPHWAQDLVPSVHILNNLPE